MGNRTNKSKEGFLQALLGLSIFIGFITLVQYPDWKKYHSRLEFNSIEWKKDNCSTRCRIADDLFDKDDFILGIHKSKLIDLLGKPFDIEIEDESESESYSACCGEDLILIIADLDSSGRVIYFYQS